MARKARQRISYVLPLSNSTGAHRLGVNGLAIDDTRSILYSGGRDGVICVWDLHLNLKSPPASTSPASTLKRQVQAHTHWINDIALAQSNQVLLSASSDVTVKSWRPATSDNQPPQTIGLHSDYVKTLAVPSPTADWVVSGGLDRKIHVWDLSGAGQKLCVDVGNDDAASLSVKEKGSVYALAANQNIICSGGPESTVRVWDTRTAKRITRLVGHTDNVRDILASQDGSTIITASSDRTVKVWSTTAGRCLYTLTMHDTSVWSLFSAHPGLSVFYSSDKSGLVAKTDTRKSVELDEGLSLALCKEHEGVHKVCASGGYVWTATSRPSIHRWLDFDTEDVEVDLAEAQPTNRFSMMTTKRHLSTGQTRFSIASAQALPASYRRLPSKHLLRLSNVSFLQFMSQAEGDHDSVPNRRISIMEKPLPDLVLGQPVRKQADYVIEGQNGLIKHLILNDRRHILTLDTAGEVVMWDLLRCIPIRSFGKRGIEEVKDEVATSVAVANWCTVNTRVGNVAVVLEEHNCFDAELYADELDLDERIEFKEDQRINLGKWVLRYLFGGVITEEIERDQMFRARLLHTGGPSRIQRENAPSSIHLPQSKTNGWHAEMAAQPSATTLRAAIGVAKHQGTPSMTIAAVTSAPSATSPRLSEPSTVPPLQTDAAVLSHDHATAKAAPEKSGDYFSSLRTGSIGISSPGGSVVLQTPVTPGADTTNHVDSPTTEKATPSKEGLFGKKFRVGRSFSGMKKLGRSSTSKEERPSTIGEKEESETDSKSSDTSHSRVVDDNFLGTVQKVRFGYEDSLHAQMQSHQAHENGLPITRRSIELPSAMTPSLPQDTPVLKPPSNTILLIQEDRPESGGVVDLFECTVGSIGRACDQVERIAPMWLGDVLLRNQIPPKDPVKISFNLEPMPGSDLPGISADGSNRLNANRMLRARKVLTYIAERIEPQNQQQDSQQPNLRPEEYLELWCQGQLVLPTMTLATIRVYLWRGGGDICLRYKANGRKQILHGASTRISTGGSTTSTSTANVSA